MWLQRLSRKKEAESTDLLSTNLKRCLTSFDVTLLGIGHMLGSGIYVVSPTTAKDVTGPAIIVSYLIAGVASLLAALAYADFGVRYPRSGSAYSYIYFSLGEFWAFYVGWNVVLENVLSTAACARACSAYIDSLTGYTIANSIELVFGKLPGGFWSETPDLLAFVILIGFVVFMTFGMRATSGLNNTLVCLNMIILGIVVAVGAYYADFGNWKYKPENPNFNASAQVNFVNGFLPYGWSGVFRASASCFFAYVGFDAIAAAGEEALNPQKSLPIATLSSMLIVTTVYVLVSGVMTLMIYFADISKTSGLPEAFAYHGAYWAQYIVSVGAIAGMSTVIMATVFAMARVCYAMADDGLLHEAFAIVQPRSQIPIVSMYFFGLLAAIIAMLLDIETIIEMLSIGTLMAYLLVACALLVSKYTPPEQTIDLQLESATAFPKVSDSPKLSQVIPRGGSLYKVARKPASNGHILKSHFAFVSKFLPQDYSQRFLVIVLLCVLVLSTVVACLMIQVTATSWAAIGWVAMALSLCTIVLCTFLLFAHELPENKSSAGHQYNMPLVPFLPVCSIVINTGLMMTLEIWTWLRLVAWVALGLLIYFSHGIRHSKLNHRS
ncbi:cationic amino acid transporter 4 [Galendromus occidentalis]|uniref:Cationic amino acid transporter 4 n=1 Tax=Galendromus occidentalis TaxID=34638 RepID=A0AAJ6QT48_9ACAR|nr:cationic amino acid transporter 4 [Galendromus occidentalis]